MDESMATEERLEDKAQEIRKEILDQVDSKLKYLISSLTHHESSYQNLLTVGASESSLSKLDTSQNGTAGDQGDLLKSSHFRSIYHVFVAVLVVIILKQMVNDLFDHGSLDLRFDLIRWGFGKLSLVLSIWGSMFASTLALYIFYNEWSQMAGPIGLLDYIWLSLYTLFLCGFMVLPVYYLRSHDMPIVSSVIVACEQVRMVMKVHAFVRENVAKTIRKRQGLESDKGPIDADDTVNPSDEKSCPDFDKYLYFLFAPTLIYRDDYPRTASIDWDYVGSNFAQVLGSLFYCYYLITHFCIPVFQDFSPDHVTLKTFLLGMFSCVLPGTLCLLLAFFAVLHSWLNAFAEMLRFGDRMFYKDWWNSTSFSNYYRTWNVVVHDWLYAYVYKDVLAATLGNRVSATLTVFFLSALVHEYIIIVAFRFFYPVMFVEFFGFGVLMFLFTGQKESRGWNVIMWLSLFIGTGLMMCLYNIEHYARKNCGPTYFPSIPASDACTEQTYPEPEGSNF